VGFNILIKLGYLSPVDFLKEFTDIKSPWPYTDFIHDAQLRLCMGPSSSEAAASAFTYHYIAGSRCSTWP
jgi:hypothetical protein